jgi:hypothetical protein
MSAATGAVPALDCGGRTGEPPAEVEAGGQDATTEAEAGQELVPPADASPEASPDADTDHALIVIPPYGRAPIPDPDDKKLP